MMVDFETLTKEEARKVLGNFLELESKAVHDMLSTASAEGIDGGFSVGSVVPVLEWVVAKLNTVPKEPDETLPWWIRECDSYVEGLFEFDRPSEVLVLRAAYYMGESFVRNFELLSWSTGNPETVEHNMPVVIGFQDGMEMAPVMIVRNLTRRILSGRGAGEDIKHVVDKWVSFVPQ